MLKDLNIPYQTLAERGFSALPRNLEPHIPMAPGLSSVRALIHHPLNALEDIHGGLRFTEFEDEVVPFVHCNDVYELFATDTTTSFLFIGRTDGHIYRYSDWSPDRRGPTFEIINADIAAFARCFCMERAICFRMRAHLVGLPEADRSFHADRGSQDERELRDFIEAVDAAALRSVYWSTLLYEIGEGFYQPIPGLPYLIERGRWRG